MHWGKGVGWVAGEVIAFNPDSHSHTIAFSDGDEREIDLKKSKRKCQFKPRKEVKPEALG